MAPPGRGAACQAPAAILVLNCTAYALLGVSIGAPAAPAALGGGCRRFSITLTLQAFSRHFISVRLRSSRELVSYTCFVVTPKREPLDSRSAAGAEGAGAEGAGAFSAFWAALGAGLASALGAGLAFSAVLGVNSGHPMLINCG